MPKNDARHRLIYKHSDQSVAEAADDDGEQEESEDEVNDELMPSDDAADFNTSATVSHASQNVTSQSDDLDADEIKTEDDADVTPRRPAATDVSNTSYGMNQQSVADSSTTTLQNENEDEVLPEEKLQEPEQNIADADIDEAETVQPPVERNGAVVVENVVNKTEKTSQPNSQPSVESETDDALVAGGGTDIDTEGSDIEFVELSADALREFDIDIRVPEKPEIITHLQKTFQSRRLVIDKMVAENFKSFGGVHHLGHFHPRFIIVNGPNGCGKSNVIDGLLFVFGYRSKRLRVERVAELIYNHPDQRKQPQECRVEVFMKVIKQTGDDTFEDVPGEVVRVARVGRKNGSSDYYLDGAKTPQKNVVERLKTYGIDMDHHRFLILQGEVEQIALMPPKGKNEHEEGLLEYLEDIIGTSRLHEPMQQLQGRLDDYKKEYEIKAKDQLLKRNEVVKLEQSRRDAERVLFEHNAINSRRYLIKLVQRRRVAADIDAAKDLLDAKKLEEEAVSAELAKSDEIKSNLQSDLKAAQKAVTANVKQREDLESQHTAAENQISQLQVDMEHAEHAKVRLEKECANLQKEIDNIDTLPERLQTEIAQLEADRPVLEQQVADNKQQYDAIIANSKTAAEKFQRDRHDCIEKSKPIKAKRLAKKNARDLKQQEHDAANRAYNEAKAKFDKLMNEQADLGIDLHTLSEELNSIDEKISTKAQLLQDRAAARQRCREEIVRLEQEVAAKRIEVDQARAMNQQPTHRANDSREIKALMEAKQNGTLPGIVGRLGDLAGIDEKYDVAICSLLQNTLNSVVVKTAADARACITYLKEVVKGNPVTFVDLERKWQQNGDKMNELYNDNPENAPRLFDLIQFDADQPKIRAVYFSFVYNTLVAENTDQATKIAFDEGRRRRVVTLQGTVVEPSGSMVGGGKPLRGLIGREARVSRVSGQVVTPADLAALERQLDECIRLSDAEKEKQKVIEQTGRTYAEELNVLKKRKTEIPQQQAAKEARLDQELPTLLQRAQQIADENAPSAVEAEQFRLEMEQLDAELGEIDRELNVVENERKRIEKLIQSESIGAAQEAKSVLEDSRRKLADHDKKLQKARTDLSNSGQQLRKHQDQIAKKRGLIAAKDAAIVDLTEKLRQAEQQLEKLDADVKSIKAAEIELTEAENSAREALADHAKKHEHHIRLQEALRLELEAMRKQHVSKNKILHTFDRELQRILTQIVELGPSLAAKNAKFLKHDYTNEQLDALDPEHLEQKLKKHERRVAEANLGKPTDAQRILNQYRQLHDVWMASAALAKAVETKRKKCEQVYRQLQNQRFEEFFAAYNTINQELKWIFRKLTTGGCAALSVADDLVFYESGIDFKVQPLMKPWREISHLSGGEKTLSSLALIFALHKYRPTPFYIMDEIDAALDHRNVTLVGLFVKLQAAAGQFIVVSHRPEMIVKADRIIGITKPGGQTCSMSISCDLDQSKSIQELMDEEKKHEKTKRQQKRATQEQQKQQKRQRKTKSQRGGQKAQANVSERMNGSVEAVDIDDDSADPNTEADEAVNTSLSTSLLDTSLSSMPVESTMNLQTRFAGIRLEQQALTKAAEAAAAAARLSNNIATAPVQQHSSNNNSQQSTIHEAQQQDGHHVSSRSLGVRKRSLAEIACTAPEARTSEESQRLSQIEQYVMPPDDSSVSVRNLPTRSRLASPSPRISTRHSSAASSTTTSSSRRHDKKRQRVVPKPPLPLPARFLPSAVRATRSGSVRSLAVVGVPRPSRSRHDETASCVSGRTRGKKMPPPPLSIRESQMGPQKRISNVPRSKQQRQFGGEFSRFDEFSRNLSDASG